MIFVSGQQFLPRSRVMKSDIFYFEGDTEKAEKADEMQHI